MAIVKDRSGSSGYVDSRLGAASWPLFFGNGEVSNANGDNIDVWLGPTAIQPEPVTAGFQPNILSSSADASGSWRGYLEDV